MREKDLGVLMVLAGLGAAAFFLLRPPAAPTGPLRREGPIYGTGARLTAPGVPVEYGTTAPPEPTFAERAWQKVKEVFTGEPPTVDPGTYKSPAQYRAELAPIFRRVEQSFAMPRGLLEAIADRESRFRHDIISCQKLGLAGEEGIMQLKPRFHLASKAERCNPEIAIPYAGRYLAKNYLRFGNSWDMAVIAYTWGPTDLENKGLNAAPAAKKEYLAWVKARPYVAGFA